jgi:hypothetical protein
MDVITIMTVIDYTKRPGIHQECWKRQELQGNSLPSIGKLIVRRNG